MGVLFIILGCILVVINISIACIAIHEGGHGFEIDRDINVGQLLLIIFIFPLTTLILAAVRTSPWRCFKDSVVRLFEYQPFKKKK